MSDNSMMQELVRLKQIDDEIKRINGSLKMLRQQKKDAETRIQYWLEENGHPGVKFGNIIIETKDASKRERLNKDEKMNRGMLVLEQAGVSDPKYVLSEVLESMKGEKITTKKVKVKNEN